VTSALVFVRFIFRLGVWASSGSAHDCMEARGSHCHNERREGRGEREGRKTRGKGKGKENRNKENNKRGVVG
jgi:hypothetical protein